MKTSKTQVLHDESVSPMLLAKATSYAYRAMLSPILRHHYKKLSHSKIYDGPLDAAIKDYLNYDREAREKRTKEVSTSKD